MRPNKEIVDSDYLLYYLLSDHGQNQVKRRATGSTATGIRQSELRKVPVILPPLKEQSKIASILITWDEAIALTEKLIAALQQHMKGLMQRLLTGEMRFPGYEDEWQETKLKDLISIKYGRSPIGIRSENGSYPIFGTGGIVGKTDVPICPHSSIIIGRKGSIDQPQLSLSPFWAIDTTFYCTPISKINIIWLYYELGHKGLSRYNEGTSIPSLSRRTLENIKIPVPIYTEQNKIANILRTLDIYISIMQRKKTLLQLQKKSLMQRLLTGQIRVTAD